MQKTTSLSIGGQLFHIEDDAYRVLETYLETLRAHFAHESARDEILSDIEGRLAELFLASATGTPFILNRGIVEQTIKTMGYPEEISDEPARAPKEHASSPNEGPTSAPRRRLYRDTETNIVSGVCSGIAAYFGIDPGIPRAIAGGLFVLGLFSAAISSIFIGLVYLVLVIFIPEATTPAQRMEMHGEPVTVQSLSERARTEATQAQSRGEAIVRRLVDGFGRFCAALVRGGGTLLGILLTLLGFAGAFGSLFLGAVLLSSIDLYVAHELRSLVSDPLYYVGVLSFAAACFIPSFALVLAGISLMRRRSAFTVSRSISLIGVWVIASIATLVIGINRLPAVMNAVEKERASQTITQAFAQLPAFHTIDITDGRYDITVAPSSTSGVVVSGDRRLAEQVRLEVRDGVLRATQDETRRACLLCHVSPVQLTLSTSSPLERIALGGAVRATVTSSSTAPLEVALHDAGRLTLLGRTDRLTVRANDISALLADGFVASSLEATVLDAARAELRSLSSSSASSSARLNTRDSGRISIQGTADQVVITAQDVSRILAETLTSAHVEATLQDAAHATVEATQSLKATTRDVSHLFYVGSPSSTQFSSEDASSISPR